MIDFKEFFWPQLLKIRDITKTLEDLRSVFLSGEQLPGKQASDKHRILELKEEKQQKDGGENSASDLALDLFNYEKIFDGTLVLTNADNGGVNFNILRNKVASHGIDLYHIGKYAQITKVNYEEIFAYQATRDIAGLGIDE